MIRDQLVARLKEDEGTGPTKNGRLLPYMDCCGLYWRKCACDHSGTLTIGFGANLDEGISLTEAEFMLNQRIDSATLDARRFGWFKTMSDVRQACVVQMVFNMGMPTFLQFRMTIAALAKGDYALAAAQSLKSLWAKQVGKRATRIAQMLVSDQWR